MNEVQINAYHSFFYIILSSMRKWAIKISLSIAQSLYLKNNFKKHFLHALDSDHQNLHSEQQDRQFHVCY